MKSYIIKSPGFLFFRLEFMFVKPGLCDNSIENSIAQYVLRLLKIDWKDF
jgi:hypothetical protein